MKRVLSLLLSLVLCLSIIPMSVSAYPTKLLKVDDTEIYTTTNSDKWSWDDATKTLTILQNFESTNPFLLYENYNYTINLNGHDISLNTNKTYTEGIRIYKTVNLNIVGNGSITCYGNSYGIQQDSTTAGTLTVGAGAKLICDGSTYGIKYNSVDFADGAMFDIKGNGKAVYAVGSFNLHNNQYELTPTNATLDTAKRIISVSSPEPDPEPYEEIKVTTLINEYLYTGEYGNETVVVDDIRAFDTIFNSHVVNAWSSVYEWTIIPAEVNSVILKNNIHEKLANEDKRVEFVFDRAIVDAEVQKESVYNSLRVTVDEGVAKHWQKKAMDTDCVISEIKVEYNGAYTKNSDDVVIAVPICCANAKVFYLIDDYTIGEVPCETNAMYCFFNFYKNGTYVICKDC